MVAVTYGAVRIAATSLAAKKRKLAQPKGKGILARLFDAMIEARMRQAYRELALHPMWTRDVTPVESKELPFGR